MRFEIDPGSNHWTNAFKSNYSSMCLRGTMNGWDATTMSLVANNTWQVKVTLAANVDYEFKFDGSGNWTSGENWGGSGTGSSGTAVVDGGNLHYTTTIGRSYTFTFNDSNRAYSIE